MGEITEQMIVDKIKDLISKGISWKNDISKNDISKWSFSIDEIRLTTEHSVEKIKVYIEEIYIVSFYIHRRSVLINFLNGVINDRMKTLREKAINYLNERQ